MKKIIKRKLKELKTYRILKEAIQYDPDHMERMHPDIERKLGSRRHPLGAHPSYPKSDDAHYEEKIASNRFSDLTRKAKRYLGVNQLDSQSLMSGVSALPSIIQMESPNKDKLVELTIKIIKKEFDLTDEIDFDLKIVNRVTTAGMKKKPKEEEIEFESQEEIEQADAEVNKRRMLNALIQGAAKKGHYMFHMVEDELERIDPRLIGLYGKLMSTNDLMLWLIGGELPGSSDEGDMDAAGRVQVDFSGDKPKVIAEATIFPVLLHEAIKGVMEVMASHGLPKNKKIRKYVINRADFLNAEIWDLRLGPGLWEKFVNAIDESAYDVRHYLFHEIVSMPANEFNTFMKELFAGTTKGKQMLVDMANTIKNDISSDDYDSAMKQYDDDDPNIDDIDISDLFG